LAAEQNLFNKVLTLLVKCIAGFVWHQVSSECQQETTACKNSLYLLFIGIQDVTCISHYLSIWW